MAINALVYEHFLYVPMIGIALIVSWYGIQFALARNLKKTAVIEALIMLIAVLSILSVKRIFEWRTAIGFYQNLLTPFAQ